jgi:glycosyltransferase involved in cell wall biosynthesis
MEHVKKTRLSALENPYQNKEIIIVDDHSTDDTYQQALPFLEGGVFKLVKRSGRKGSRAAAVHYGTLFATGDICMIAYGMILVEIA